MKPGRPMPILVLATVLLSLASATTVIPMSVEKLVSASSHVVEATAVQAWSEWNPQHSIIFTYTKFQVTRHLKGQVPALSSSSEVLREATPSELPACVTGGPVNRRSCLSDQARIRTAPWRSPA